MKVVGSCSSNGGATSSRRSINGFCGRISSSGSVALSRSSGARQIGIRPRDNSRSSCSDVCTWLVAVVISVVVAVVVVAVKTQI